MIDFNFDEEMLGKINEVFEKPDLEDLKPGVYNTRFLNASENNGGVSLRFQILQDPRSIFINFNPKKKDGSVNEYAVPIFTGNLKQLGFDKDSILNIFKDAQNMVQNLNQALNGNSYLITLKQNKAGYVNPSKIELVENQGF